MKRLSKEYRDYINSAEWAEKRAQALRHYDYTCEKKRQGGGLARCGGPLQVHHRHYRNLGHESMEDLKVLCKKHHKYHHIKKDFKSFMKALRDA